MAWLRKFNLHFYFEDGLDFVREVAFAVAGASGQKCRGYRPFKSLATSVHEPCQKPGRSWVICIGRCAGDNRMTNKGILPFAMVGWFVSPKSSCTRTSIAGAVS